MIALTTKTLKDYIEEGGEMFENLFSHFPSFIIDDTLTLNFKDLFIDKYDIREIGAETDTLFAHYLKEKLNSALIEYVPKINTFIDNFNDLFKFTAKLEYSESKISNGSNKNTYFLNPVNSSTGSLKVQNVNQNEGGTSDATMRTRDGLLSYRTSRVEILNEIMKIKNIYNECLNSFEVLFMGVL